MAKGAYIGVGGVARKIKKGYIGVGGVARKIKKAYIGIGGVARPCWSGGELAYYGTIDNLSYARHGLSAVSVGDYAIFAGGGRYKEVYGSANYYTSSLVQGIISAAAPSLFGAATTVSSGDADGTIAYAIFGGGQNVSGSSLSQTSEAWAFNSSLTRINTALSIARYNLAATTVGNYAIFGGGRQNSSYQGTVDAFTNALSRVSTYFDVGIDQYAAATVSSSDADGTYALFGGGYLSSETGWEGKRVYAYSQSLVKTLPTEFAVALSNLAATNINKYVIFTGDYHGMLGTQSSSAYAYDTSLTRTLPSPLSVGRHQHSATSLLNKYAIFAGGMSSQTNTHPQIVEAYDSSLTLTSNLSIEGRYMLAATTIGNYALFGGGSVYNSGFTYKSTVDAFTIA